MRVASLVKLLQKGHSSSVVISHDSVWCWKGQMRPPALVKQREEGQMSMRFTRVITPMLKEAGISNGIIESMLTDNPRRYFGGDPVPAR